MEYYVVRAMMIGMLPKDDIERLHTKENTLGRGLMPSEMTYIFKTRDIKEFYRIPEDDEIQSTHAQRVKREIGINNCLKTLSNGYVSSTNTETLHEYDWNIYNKLSELNLNYEGGKGVRGRLKDLVTVLPFILWTFQA